MLFRVWSEGSWSPSAHTRAGVHTLIPSCMLALVLVLGWPYATSWGEHIVWLICHL